MPIIITGHAGDMGFDKFVAGIQTGQNLRLNAQEESRRQQVFDMELQRAQQMMLQEDAKGTLLNMQQQGLGTPQGEAMAQAGMGAAGAAMGSVLGGITGAGGMAPLMAKLMKNMAPSAAKIFPNLSNQGKQEFLQEEATKEQGRLAMGMVKGVMADEAEGWVPPGSAEALGMMVQGGDIEGAAQQQIDWAAAKHRTMLNHQEAQSYVDEWSEDAGSKFFPGTQDARIALIELQSALAIAEKSKEPIENLDEIVARWHEGLKAKPADFDMAEGQEAAAQAFLQEKIEAAVGRGDLSASDRKLLDKILGGAERQPPPKLSEVRGRIKEYAEEIAASPESEERAIQELASIYEGDDEGLTKALTLLAKEKKSAIRRADIAAKKQAKQDLRDARTAKPETSPAVEAVEGAVGAAAEAVGGAAKKVASFPGEVAGEVMDLHDKAGEQWRKGKGMMTSARGWKQIWEGIKLATGMSSVGSKGSATFTPEVQEKKDAEWQELPLEVKKAVVSLHKWAQEEGIPDDQLNKLVRELKALKGKIIYENLAERMRLLEEKNK